VTFSLPEVNLKKLMYSSWAFHVDEHSDSSSTYDIIIVNQKRSSWRLISDQTPMKDRDPCTLSSVEALIEVHMSTNEPQTLRDKYSRANKILDAEYKPASLDDIIKTCENIHVEEQHQLKILPQKV
jgi:hypothetical protein